MRRGGVGALVAATALAAAGRRPRRRRHHGRAVLLLRPVADRVGQRVHAERGGGHRRRRDGQCPGRPDRGVHGPGHGPARHRARAADGDHGHDRPGEPRQHGDDARARGARGLRLEPADRRAPARADDVAVRRLHPRATDLRALRARRARARQPPLRRGPRRVRHAARAGAADPRRGPGDGRPVDAEARPAPPLPRPRHRARRRRSGSRRPRGRFGRACSLRERGLAPRLGRPRQPSVSRRSSSSSFSDKAAATTFSSRWATDDVPGIGRTTGETCSSQAMATPNGVVP